MKAASSSAFSFTNEIVWDLRASRSEGYLIICIHKPKKKMLPYEGDLKYPVSSITQCEDTAASARENAETWSLDIWNLLVPSVKSSLPTFMNELIPITLSISFS